MFEDWGDFYLLIGSAGGALIGLLFVVVTLTAGGERRLALRAASVYMTPTLFHFAVVLASSGLALSPRLDAKTIAAGYGVLAAAGIVHTGYILLELRPGGPIKAPHWSDIWCYGAAPFAIYVGMALGAWEALSDARATALTLAGVLMALLLIAIRNAWDLVTWLAPREPSESLKTMETPATSRDGKVTSS